MNQAQRLEYMLHFLLNESPRYQGTILPQTNEERWHLARALMNVRPPDPVSAEFLDVQDAYLTQVASEKGIVEVDELSSAPGNAQLALWRGDITRLRIDAIVNAANSALLGCFVPGHACIDNVIHSYAGVQLRLECAELMRKQGHEEPTGSAQITAAYNLPSKHVIHTVGPIVSGNLTQHDCDLLASCYRACLALAVKNNLSSIAFCCISTGEFRFPQEEAAAIALKTVRDYLDESQASLKVLFNVFKESDHDIYKHLL